jgi:hypothetical protein
MLNQTVLDLILGALKRKSLSIVCVGAIGTGSRITRQSLQKKKDSDLHSVRSPAARLGPNKISIARLPVTGSNFFGREADIALLDEAWQISVRQSLPSLPGLVPGNRRW